MVNVADAVASVVIQSIEPPPSTLALFHTWMRRRGAVILESSRPDHPDGRYSILAAEPVETVRLESGQWTPDLAGELAGRLRTTRSIVTRGDDLPFRGGWIGYLTYESGLSHERVRTGKRPEARIPAVQFQLFDSALVLDAGRSAWFAVAVEWAGTACRGRGSAAERIAGLRRIVDAAVVAEPCVSQSDRTRQAIALESSPSELAHPNMDRDAYLRRARRVQEYIAAGDVFQANLSVRFSVPTTLSAGALYLRLRDVSPAPFSAYIPTPRATIVSSSPELFLDLRGRDVRTRPIKGTRPRRGVPALDRRAEDELSRDEKERAELAMIVDLLRNDLGRVCEAGSVRVDDAGSVEAHSSVFHRVATLSGCLREDQGWSDLLRSAFPGGSITGAPKIRAMEIIDELEPTPRGAYCGAMGWIGLDGTMRLNVAIRTSVHTGPSVDVYAGGAITADSDPEREYDEILAKAAGMFRALDSRSPRRTSDEGRKRGTVVA